MTEQLRSAHDHASENTPDWVNIPQNWAGIAVWALGKWGIGIVFLALLVPVYLDLRESNKNMVELTRANVTALTALAQRVEDNGKRIEQFQHHTQQ